MNNGIGKTFKLCEIYETLYVGDVLKCIEGASGFVTGENYTCVRGKDGWGDEGIGPVNPASNGCGIIASKASTLSFQIIERAARDNPYYMGHLVGEDKISVIEELQKEISVDFPNVPSPVIGVMVGSHINGVPIGEWEVTWKTSTLDQKS